MQNDPELLNLVDEAMRSRNKNDKNKAGLIPEMNARNDYEYY